LMSGSIFCHILLPRPRDIAATPIDVWLNFLPYPAPSSSEHCSNTDWCLSQFLPYPAFSSSGHCSNTDWCLPQFLPYPAPSSSGHCSNTNWCLSQFSAASCSLILGTLQQHRLMSVSISAVSCFLVLGTLQQHQLMSVSIFCRILLPRPRDIAATPIDVCLNFMPYPPPSSLLQLGPKCNHLICWW